MAQHRRHHDPPGRRSARRRLAPEARVTRAERRVASPRVVGVNDLRPLARRRVPRAGFDYIDGGADGEVTLRENCRAFDDLTLRPRQAVAGPTCDLRTRVLRRDLALPVMLAPIGYLRMMHPQGEVAAARAAGAAGTGCILSTISGHRLEDGKAGSPAAVVFHPYPVGGAAPRQGAA